MKAVHFGAGNIGRGFVGLILHNAGYEVVFADVNADVIDALASTPTYEVKEVGARPSSSTVSGYRALNSRTDEAAVIAEVSTADIVTTAVGPNVLRFIAPVIAAALEHRPAGSARLAVMACENAINATDLLETAVRAALPDASDGWIRERAVFANTAVDRIVPAQASDAGLDVTVEDFFEWAIDRTPFGGNAPVIPDAHYVDDLAPFIERKLFTVNTGHATVAYHGFLAGAPTLADAIGIDAVRREVEAVLDETSAVLIAKHEFAREEHRAYVERTLERFQNPHLPDTPTRVGRQPLRKLGRNERFISPAVESAALGSVPQAIVRAIGAAVQFDVPEDPESVELRSLLGSLGAAEFTSQVTGLSSGPLFDEIVATVGAVQNSTSSSGR